MFCCYLWHDPCTWPHHHTSKYIKIHISKYIYVFIRRRALASWRKVIYFLTPSVLPGAFGLPALRGATVVAAAGRNSSCGWTSHPGDMASQWYGWLGYPQPRHPSDMDDDMDTSHRDTTGRVVLHITHITAHHIPPEEWYYISFISPHTTYHRECYGVASISRLLKIIGLFCTISSLL